MLVRLNSPESAAASPAGRSVVQRQRAEAKDGATVPAPSRVPSPVAPSVATPHTPPHTPVHSPPQASQITPPKPSQQGAGLALALHAALMAHAHSPAAAQELVITLARQLRFARVSLVWARGERLQLLAQSDGAGSAAETADGSTATALRPGNALLEAGAEAFDQSAAVVWPPVEGMPPRITRAHALLAALTNSSGLLASSQASSPSSSGSAASVLLVVRGQRVGVLCAQRSAGPPVSAAELAQLEDLACLAAPTLWLLKQNERGALQRAQDALRARWARASHRHRVGVRSAAWLCAGGALCAALLPWPAQVGGRARLEGAVQRVLAAPADGFVQRVHARAGDTVRAGQPLLELADQDLQLERQRWESQLAQHLDALATAQARADRTQLVLHQSRADDAQAQLALVDERLLRSRLVAPFDGIVVQGDWSQQLGAPVKEGTELLTLAPLDRYRVVIEVDERDVPLVQDALPQPAAAAVAGPRSATPAAPAAQGSLTLAALPWTTLPLRLTRLSPVAKPVEGRNVFEAEAELLLPAGALPSGLRPGLQGSARIDSTPASPLLHLLRRSLGAARVAWWGWWG